jgi:hypothetical protein
VSAEFEQVPEDEFRQFVRGYPNELEVDRCGISEPPLVSYNDFTNGLVWPESMVAKYHDGSGRYWIKRTTAQP